MKGQRLCDKELTLKKMAEEKETIILDQRQILELDEIFLDKDKEAAFRFLEENIYKPIKKRREAHCKPPF